jgi:hypothetical protein
VFADVPAATNALRGMQGSQFYDRPLVRAPRAALRGALTTALALARQRLLMPNCGVAPRAQRIAFARGKSDVVSKADGTWVPPEKRVKGAAGARAFARTKKKG